VGRATARRWCEEKLREFLSKSPTAVAIGYTLKHRAALMRYLDDGAIAIDDSEVCAAKLNASTTKPSVRIKSISG
jgi:hypothetical protein